MGSEAGGAHSTPARRRKRERERLNCTKMGYGAVDREECVYMAKLAEQAERYDEMVDEKELSVEERPSFRRLQERDWSETCFLAHHLKHRAEGGEQGKQRQRYTHQEVPQRRREGAERHLQQHFGFVGHVSHSLFHERGKQGLLPQDERRLPQILGRVQDRTGEEGGCRGHLARLQIRPRHFLGRAGSNSPY